jgi:hypothetical protein
MTLFTAYDQPTAQLLYGAFNSAWFQLELTGDPSWDRVSIADRLIRGLVDAEAKGERDPEQLKRAALAMLAA